MKNNIKCYIKTIALFIVEIVIGLCISLNVPTSVKKWLKILFTIADFTLECLILTSCDNKFLKTAKTLQIIVKYINMWL